ncbi:hypothetical protein ACETK8_00270 [Brevundimonas staleyi]|uniref:Uncharacterized protein n=1 Tax=Brevundimonas staleyi TaxID=74326 RepID=A0ABW0FS77_9CAUL
MSDAEPPPHPVRKPFGRWRRWLPRAAFESVLIVFSVVLALMLTDWADRRRTAAEVAEVRGYFIAEIRANRAILVSDFILPHHRRLHAAFGTAAEGEPTQDKAMQAYREVFRTGIHVAPLRDAVWRSAETGDLLAEMPIEDLFLLADIYKAQGTLADMSQGFIAGTPGVLSALESGEGVRAAIATGQLHLSDVVASEEGLVRLYDRALAKLDRDASNRTDDAAPAKR